MALINDSYHSIALRVTPVMAVMLVASAIVSPSGGQPMAVLILLFCLPLLMFRHSQSINPISPMWLVTLCFPLFAAIPLFIVSDTGEALAGASRYFFAALVLLSFRGITLSPQAILRAATAAGIIAVVVNIGQIGEMRVNWGAGYLDSAYVSVMLMSLSLGQLHIDRHKIGWRLFAVVGIVCLVFATLKTGTRGAWPAMIIVFLMPLFLLDLSKRKKMIIAGTGLVILLISLLTVPSVRDRIDLTVSEIQTYHSDGNRSTSMGYRLDFWKIALRCFSEGPLWGVSYSRRSELMEEYIKANPVSANIGTDGRSSSHNEFMNAMAKKGLLGAVAILLLYLIPLRYFVSRLRAARSDVSRALSLSGAGLVFTMILCGITEAPLMNVRVGTTYGFLLVFLYHLLHVQKVHAR